MSNINKTRAGMKLIKVLSSLFVMGLFLIPSSVKATHIVGGEITYRCLASWTFEVTLTVRRDCEFGAAEAQFDDPASIGIYDSSGELLPWLGQGGQLSIPFNLDDTLSTNFTPGCDFLGEGVCVHTSTYIDTITLPFRPGGYILAYSRCCRNETLTNITEPLNTGATFSVGISNKASIECNNTPTFDEAPDLYICANEELTADMSATDSDGDSLVYRLCIPHNGATPDNPQPQPPRGQDFESVNFVTGFGVDNFLGGTPLVIDSETGIITATPNLVGQFLVGVCVDEYRDGVLIGSIKRDFQYNVRECIPSPEASFTLESNPICDGLEVTFTNTSTETDSYEWFFDYPNTDPAFTSTEDNPTFTFPSDGFYNVKLIATRSSDGCFDELVLQELGVFDSQLSADFNTDFIANACFEDSIDITLVSSSVEPSPDYGIASYSWTLSGSGYEGSGEGDSLRLIVPGLDSISVTLLVTSETGCTSEITQVINSNENGLVASFDPNFIVNECGTDSINITLESTSTSTVSEVTIDSYSWAINTEGFSQTATGETFTLTVPRLDSIDLVLMIVGSNGCSNTLATFIDTEPINDEDIAFLADTILICPGDTSFILATPNPELTYDWTPEDGLIFTDGNTYNPQFTFAEGETMAVYSLVVSDSVCSRGAGEVVLLLNESSSDAELSFSISPMCGTTTVCYQNTSTPNDGDYEFDFGAEGGLIDSMGDMICYTYSDFGLFEVTLTYLEGCGNTTLMRNVIVAPDVDITVDSDTVMYCAGDEVMLSVASEGDGTIVEWYNANEDLIGDDFEVTYTPDGDELITVIGFNAGGCFDTAHVQLIESKFEFELNVVDFACAGSDVNLSVSTIGDGDISYSWSPEGAISGSNEGEDIVINISEVTEFTLSMTNNDDGCSLDTSFTVMVSDVTAEIIADPAEVFQCNPTDVGVVDEDPDFTYEWNTGATTPSFTSDTLLETTTFSVTVTDENGCTAEAALTVNVLLPDCNESDVFLPTAFTPNGDNINDVLKVESNFVKSMNLVIYDRWGKLMFTSTNVDDGWDGTFDGNALTPDVYAYKLSATCSNGEQYEKIGNISLLR